MALVKGVNSYGTVEEADLYFQDRIDVAAWDTADVAEKAKALVTSTFNIDALEYLGVVSSDSQKLAFPRLGDFFDPRSGKSVSMDPVPDRVLKACYEQAYHLLNNDGLLDDTGSVMELEISGVKLTEIKDPRKLSSVAYKLLKPLFVANGSKMWWRAN